MIDLLLSVTQLVTSIIGVGGGNTTEYRLHLSPDVKEKYLFFLTLQIRKKRISVFLLTIYVVHSISFQTFFVQAFKIVVDS